MAEETVNSINPASPKPVLRKPGEDSARPALRSGTAGQEEASGTEAPPACETLADASRPEALDRLKGMTQRLKSVTQEIPAQAILHRTGIIASQAAASESQTQAAKSKTMRISLSEAIGAAPAKEESAATPMKTIRVKRPVDLPRPVDSAATGAAESAPSMTQRRTLRITRPGGAHPRASARLARPALARPQTDVKGPETNAAAAVGDIPEIADIPEMPVQASAAPSKTVVDAPGAVTVLSLVVQIVACAVMGFVAWMLFQNCAQIAQ